MEQGIYSIIQICIKIIEKSKKYRSINLHSDIQTEVALIERYYEYYKEQISVVLSFIRDNKLICLTIETNSSLWRFQPDGTVYYWLY